MTVILFSCAAGKFNGPTVCVHVPEVPTKLISRSVERADNELSIFSLHLTSVQKDVYFEAAKIRLMDRKSGTTIIGRCDSTGFYQRTIPPGYYSIEIDHSEALGFTIDSVQIESGNNYKFEIMLGELSGFETIQLK